MSTSAGALDDRTPEREHPLAPLRGIALLLAFRASLDVTYVLGVVPAFEHEGFTRAETPARLALSYVLTVLAGVGLRTDTTRPSQVLSWLLLATPVLPLQTLAGWRGDSMTYVAACTGAAILLRRLALVRWPDVHVLSRSVSLPIALASAGVLVTLLELVRRGGLAFASLDAQAVYLLRDTVLEQTASGFMAYLIEWSAKVFVPVVVAAALAAGWTRLAVVALVLELPIAVLTAQKVPLGLVALLGAVLLSMRGRRPAEVLLLLFAAANGLMLLLGRVLESPLPIAFVSRRIFFVPANMNAAYHAFFADAGSVRFSTILPEAIAPYRFPYPPAQMVGDYLAPGAGLWANTGFLGTGFMHLGLGGLLFYAVLVSLPLGLTDALARTRGATITLLVVTSSFVSLFTSADLPTALLSHGIALSILALVLFPATHQGRP